MHDTPACHDSVMNEFNIGAVNKCYTRAVNVCHMHWLKEIKRTGNDKLRQNLKKKTKENEKKIKHTLVTDCDFRDQVFPLRI